MEKFKPEPEQNITNKSNVESSKEKEIELKMEEFYKKHFEEGEEGARRISLEELRELKEIGITTERFLDHLCQNHGVLLHGSIHEVPDDKLRSRRNKIFASNKSAIAIMRSLYSNLNVNLEYPYFIDEENPLVLEVHTQPDKNFIKVERGFVYVVDSSGFKNIPEGSWQFIGETTEIKFTAVVETESDDFDYPVKFFDDLNVGSG